MSLVTLLRYRTKSKIPHNFYKVEFQPRITKKKISANTYYPGI